MFVQRAAALKPMRMARMFASSIKDYPIDGFFNAKSYAIVGASDKPGSLGLSICTNFLKRYQGDVYFINPKGILNLSCEVMK